MINMTTLERFLDVYHNALGDDQRPWRGLDDPNHRKHVDAALHAVSMLPRQFFFSVPGHGLCSQGLEDVKASLSDEQRFADAQRGNATKG